MRIISILSLVVACAQGIAQTTLRYDLASGDHLVYHEIVDRKIHGKTVDFATHAEWTNHVLIHADPNHPESFLVGAQRNRTSADLLHSTTSGKDTTNADRKEFTARVNLRGSAFAEASHYDRTGLPSDPIIALREWTSQVLFDAHEIMPLPVEPVSIGSMWRGTSLLGIATRYAANENLHGHDCARLEGSDRANTVALKAWFCPSSSLIEKVELSAKYSVFDSSVEESISFQLQSRARNEALDAWMQSADTRQAVLQMAMLEPSLPVARDALQSMLQDSDLHLQRKVLALWIRRNLPPLAPAERDQLAKSPDPRVRELASLAATDASRPSPANCSAPKGLRSNLPPGDYWLTLHSGPVVGWPYILHVPEEYRSDHPQPAIVYLSGGAGHANDGMNGARATEESTPYILIYPQARDYWWEPESTALMRQLLHELKNTYAVDADHLYLSGSSNGGTGAFLYATLWPDQFAGVAPLMGAGYSTRASEKPLGENTSAVPLLFVHGDQDPIIPMQASVDTVDHLKGFERTAPVDLKIIPGKAHELSLDDNGGFLPAFFQNKSRNPYPKKLHVRLRTLDDPRQYWIELLEKNPGVAEIDARLEGGTLTVKSKNVRKMRLLLRPELVGNGGVKVLWNGKQVWQGSVPADCAKILATAPDGDLALGYSQEVLLEEAAH